MIRRSRLGALAVAGIALGIAGSAAAQTASASLAVTASVANNCTLSTTPVAFGTYDPLSATNLAATGSVRIRCTRGTTGTVSLGLGANASGTSRRMSDGAGTPSYLAYELKRPTGNLPGDTCPAFGAGTVWGSAAGSTLVLTAAPSFAQRVYNVCGELANGQDVPVGSYADSVVATVTF